MAEWDAGVNVWTSANQDVVLTAGPLSSAATASRKERKQVAGARADAFPKECQPCRSQLLAEVAEGLREFVNDRINIPSFIKLGAVIREMKETLIESPDLARQRGAKLLA